MKNIVTLRNDLVGLIDDLKSGQVKHAIASEISNAAGKIIGTVKVELEYAALRKVEPNIAYLNTKK